MNCDLARRLLPFARPGSADLDPADRAALGHHLDACPACAAAGAVDRAFDAGLARAVQAVPVPDGLGGRLHAGVLAARRAFWRRTVPRALLVACPLAVALAGWMAWRRPVLDPSQLAHQTYEQSG